MITSGATNSQTVSDYGNYKYMEGEVNKVTKPSIDISKQLKDMAVQST